MIATKPGPVADGAQLLADVRRALAQYVILPDAQSSTAVVLWIAATHAVPAWAHAARLVVRAPEKRCGKSRLLDIVEAMSHKPLMTVNASPSAVYRSIGLSENDPPTLLLDEADTVFGPKAGEHEDLRGLLNAGHQRNRPAIRFDAATRTVERIETFAMAALAGIGAMPDTIEDRAVVIRMRRRAPGETVSPYRSRRDGPALDRLKVRVHEWIRDNLEVLGAAVPAMPIEDRAADTWEPLVAVADLAGGEWPSLAREAAVVLTEARDATAAASTQTRLLADCRAIFLAADADALPTAGLLERLKSDPEAPWATFGPNGLTPMRLGKFLGEFDISSRNLRLPTGQAKGYVRGDFADAWARYCPEVAPPKPSQPSQSSHRDISAGQGPYSDGTDHDAKPSRSRPGNDRAVPAVPQPSHPKQPSDLHGPGPGTSGTAGTVPPTTATCLVCHSPLTHDDGTHTHPTCKETER